jgi:hypothetical protein
MPPLSASSGTPFVVQPALTAVALRRRNPVYMLIADNVMPRLAALGTKRFRWLEYAPGENMTVPDTRVGRKGSPARVEMTAVEHFDECLDYGIEDSIPLDDVAQAAASLAGGGFAIDPEVRAVEALTDLMDLDREVRVAAVACNPASYLPANVLTLAGNQQFSDFADSNPIDTILGLMDQMLFQPTSITMGQAVWTVLRQHPKVVMGVLGNAGYSGVVSRQQVADLLEVKSINVGAAWANSARPGQPVTRQRVWGKSLSMHFVDPTVTADTGVTWGFTQQYANNGAVKYASTRIEPLGLRGATVIRVGETVKELVCAPDCGALILNAVA